MSSRAQRRLKQSSRRGKKGEEMGISRKLSLLRYWLAVELEWERQHCCRVNHTLNLSDLQQRRLFFFSHQDTSGVAAAFRMVLFVHCHFPGFCCNLLVWQQRNKLSQNVSAISVCTCIMCIITNLHLIYILFQPLLPRKSNFMTMKLILFVTLKQTASYII